MTAGNQDLRANPGPGSVEAHILVVDDDAQIRQLAAKLLREHGYRASVARDGREMWQALDSAGVDLLILDVMLPGSNGLDLCREIRARSALPVIMLTALGSDTDRIGRVPPSVSSVRRHGILMRWTTPAPGIECAKA